MSQCAQAVTLAKHVKFSEVQQSYSNVLFYGKSLTLTTLQQFNKTLAFHNFSLEGVNTTLTKSEVYPFKDLGVC